MSFGLVKHNNNSISAVTSVGLTQGKMTLLQTQTASSSASISFTSNIDSTYPIYVFKFINIHPSADGEYFQFQANASGGSGYNETLTTTQFRSQHGEDGSGGAVGYQTNGDTAQGTGFQTLGRTVGNGNDECISGELYLFGISSTTFIKHFFANSNTYHQSDYSQNAYTAGYFNTSSAIDEFQFKMASGNIDSGTIKLYGIKDS